MEGKLNARWLLMGMPCPPPRGVLSLSLSLSLSSPCPVLVCHHVCFSCFLGVLLSFLSLALYMSVHTFPLCFPFSMASSSVPCVSVFPKFTPITPLITSWWNDSVVVEWNKQPHHIIMEAIVIALLVAVMVRQSYDPREHLVISKQIQHDMIEAWTPEPLVQGETQNKNINTNQYQTHTCPYGHPCTQTHTQTKHANTKNNTHVVEKGAAGRLVTFENGKICINMASTNFQGLAMHPNIERAARHAIETYGVGSCGPRGFYGTFEVHLEMEAQLAHWYGCRTAIMYADHMATCASVIPAFAKRGDVIVADEAVGYSVKQGIILSRATIRWYAHNDMEELERVLNTIQEEERASGKRKMVRRFIITEGVSMHYGDVAPLKKIVQLRNKYKYRIILDDTYALGVLGKTGKGSLEHHDVPLSEVEMLCASLDTTLASVGGFCVSQNTHAIDHQRLSGSGYCFSAASPPYTAAAALTALHLLQQNASAVEELQQKSMRLRSLLNDIQNVVVDGSSISPIIHLRLNPSRGTDADLQAVMAAAATLEEHGIMASVPNFVPLEQGVPPPSLRFFVCIHHTDADLHKIATATKAAFLKALKNTM